MPRAPGRIFPDITSPGLAWCHVRFENLGAGTYGGSQRNAQYGRVQGSREKTQRRRFRPSFVSQTTGTGAKARSGPFGGEAGGGACAGRRGGRRRTNGPCAGPATGRGRRERAPDDHRELRSVTAVPHLGRTVRGHAPGRMTRSAPSSQLRRRPTRAGGPARRAVRESPLERGRRQPGPSAPTCTADSSSRESVTGCGLRFRSRTGVARTR